MFRCHDCRQPITGCYYMDPGNEGADPEFYCDHCYRRWECHVMLLCHDVMSWCHIMISCHDVLSWCLVIMTFHDVFLYMSCHDVLSWCQVWFHGLNWCPDAMLSCCHAVVYQVCSWGVCAVLGSHHGGGHSHGGQQALPQRLLLLRGQITHYDVTWHDFTLMNNV